MLGGRGQWKGLVKGLGGRGRGKGPGEGAGERGRGKGPGKGAGERGRGESGISAVYIKDLSCISRSLFNVTLFVKVQL